MRKIYFVTVCNKRELEIIKQVKPERILISYFYSKKGLQRIVDKLGYQPEILLDSGAFSAWNTGKPIELQTYIDYVKNNIYLVERFIALDVIGDAEKSKENYIEMLNQGLSPVPVFHEGDDIEYLDYYVQHGCELIALGGTSHRGSKKFVREWIQYIQKLYPKQKFHLLGSSSRKITAYTNLYSFDSSTWIMESINGFPSHIKGKTAKDTQRRMVYNMKKKIREYDTINKFTSKLFPT